MWGVRAIARRGGVASVIKASVRHRTCTSHMSSTSFRVASLNVVSDVNRSITLRGIARAPLPSVVGTC